jgi:predicted nucleic acid-binding protein
MIYFDVSYIVRLYFEDPGWEQVRALAAQAHVSCSIHGQLETVAAFHRKLREGAVTAPQYGHVLKQFGLDCREGAYRWAPVSPSLVKRATSVYEKLPRTVFLRASDSLHLACASENGFREIYSNDRHLLAAAPYFSVKGVDVIEPGE